MESEYRCHVMTFLLCLMALNKGMNGGVNMGQYMRNTMDANQSAYSMAYTEMTNIYANCQTVNPMGAKMCATCKNYDAQNYWCNLLEQPAASATMNGGACYRYRHWELNIDESLKKCCCELERAPEEEVFNQAIARELETIAARSWTFEKQEYKKEMYKFHPIPDSTFHQIVNETGTIIKKSDNAIIVDYGEDIDNCPKNIMTLKRVYKADENGAWSAVGNAPEKKHLELSDLYSLAFPFDPIQEYFAGIYKQIDKEHAKCMEMLDRVKAKPVKHVEPVEVLDNPKVKSEALKDWIWLEKIIAIVVSVTFVLSAACCLLDAGGIIEATAVCIGAFLGLTVVNTFLAFF